MVKGWAETRQLNAERLGGGAQLGNSAIEEVRENHSLSTQLQLSVKDQGLPTERRVPR